MFATGCKIEARRPRITLPVSAVETLSRPDGGLDVALLNNSGLLMGIDGGAGRVEFQHEFRNAPSMMMVSLGMATTRSVDVALRVDSDAKFSPLETDFAVCDSRVVNGVQEPIPPNADGKWSSEEFDPPLNNLLLNRVKGTLIGIAVTPTPGSNGSLGTTFQLSVQLRNLNIGLGLRNQADPGDNAPDGYDVDVASLSLMCTAAIRRDATFDLINGGPSPCGEQSIACLPGTVTLSIAKPTTNLPPSLASAALTAWDFMGVNSVTAFAEGGVVMHFEHFAASQLGFSSGGVLQLRGQPTPTSMCSPNALVPPATPPTRALVQAHGYDGTGETRSTDGYVRSFTIRNYLGSYLRTVSSANDMLTVVADARVYPSDAVTQMFGAEFPSVPTLDLAKIATRVSVDRLNSECWTKQTVVNDVIKALPSAAFGRFDGKFRKPGEIEKFGLREFRYGSVSAADPKEVMVAMKGLGLSCGECTGYWRVDGVVGATGYPRSWPVPDDGGPFNFDVPPYMGQLWFRDDPIRQLNDLFVCRLEFHPVKDEVVIALPQVRLFDTLFDSSRVNSMGYAARGNSSTASERTFTYQGKTHRMIVVQPDCWTPGRRGACWVSDVPAPPAFTVGAVGRSGSTMPHVGVRSIVPNGNSTTYGAGDGLPWGFFDRSLIDLYSSVPSEYAQAGVTTTAWDWRGYVKTDWAHGPSFPAPATSCPNCTLEFHDGSGETDWWGIQSSTSPYPLPQDHLIPYRPNFNSDRLLARRRISTERSFCVSEDNLLVTLEEIRARNLQTRTSVSAPATTVFAPGSTGPVQVVGSGNVSGSATPLAVP